MILSNFQPYIYILIFNLTSWINFFAASEFGAEEELNLLNYVLQKKKIVMYDLRETASVKPTTKSVRLIFKE